jgi:thioredoxin reductase (NADPH)
MDVLVLNSREQLSNLEVAHSIENHPGTKRIRGKTLLERMKKQATDNEIEIIDEKTIGLIKDKNFTVMTTENNYKALSVIISTGLVSRKAGIPGETDFIGNGVSYCVLCDGPLFVDKTVAVIGGGDSAITGAIALKEMGANKVYIIHRRNEFRAEKANIEKLNDANIDKIMSSVVDEIKGKNDVESIIVRNISADKKHELMVDGVFVEIGYVPTSEITKNTGIELDSDGFIKIDENMETNVAGIFAAGDITNPKYKILVSAYYQGAIAALSAANYVSNIKGSKFSAKLH